MSGGIDKYTVALLHFDDENNVGKDECGNKWTTAGSPIVSTEQSRFGRKSLYLANNSYLNSEVVADFNFGKSDFTIDCWIYPTDSKNANAVFAMTSDYRFGIISNYGGSKGINTWMSSTGNSWSPVTGDPDGNGIGKANTIIINEWNHIALVRHDDSYMTFVNGVKDLDINIGETTAVYWSGSDGIRIGEWGRSGYYPFVGYIDEFRISNIARWIEDFTPPNICKSLYIGADNSVWGMKS